MWLNALNVPITVTTSKKKIVGDISGNVMWRRRFQPRAPSTFAASYSSALMLTSPARKIVMSYPMNTQVV